MVAQEDSCFTFKSGRGPERDRPDLGAILWLSTRLNEFEVGSR